MVGDGSTLKTGDAGFLFDHGEHWPARVICDDLRQCFGPVDQVVAYRRSDMPYHEFTIRLTGGSCPCTGRHWVSREKFREIEIGRVAGEMAKLQARLDTAA